MSISINLTQRKEKTNQNGAAPIHVRLIHKSKSRYISTGVVIPLSAWNAESQTISTDYPNAVELQVQINSKLIEYQKQINRLEILDIEVNFDTLFGQKRKKINCTVEQFFLQQTERMKKLGKVGTASKYECCLNLLKCTKPVNIRFEQIDRNLAKFEIVNFKVANGIYGAQVNMEKELVRAGLEITDNSQFKTPKGIRMKTKRRESFKELFEEYAALRGKRGYEAFTAEYDCHWWGRTTSGQSVYMDYVIQQIAEETGA